MTGRNIPATPESQNRMKTSTRVRLRTLLAAAVTGSVLTLGVATAAPAAAHVRVEASDPTPGAYAVLTFRVPGESETGARTTGLRVELPDLASVRTEVMPGWTATLDRDDAAGTVRSVTWTAEPGVGISADEFALFRISVKLPETDTLSMPAVQIYDDGTEVRWDQPEPGDGTEPDYPAPTLTLAVAEPPAASGATDTAASGATDTSARWLAGASLVVAAAAVTAAVLLRRRA